MLQERQSRSSRPTLQLPILSHGTAFLGLLLLLQEEEQRADLAARLEEMKAASDEEWEAFKPEPEQASEDLRQALGDLQGTLEGAVP